MKNAAPIHHLSAADAAFLYLERKEIPLHIASVSIFDGAIPFDEFVARITSKLDLVPRYRQIVVMPPLNLGLPTWKDDPHFDIRRHVFRVTLDPPGGEAELEGLVGRILSQLLDRGKPLWDIHVIDGLKGGRGAVIWRVHHSLADGLAGARLLEVMLDPTPEGGRGARSVRHRPLRRRPSEHSLADEIMGAVSSSLKSLVQVEEGLLGFAGCLLNEQKRNDLKGLLGLLPEFAASVERLPFNRPCAGDRKFCWAEFDFVDIKAVREALGGTVNDVVLTVLTRALARYVKLHGQTVVNRLVRIVCPVGLRKGDPREDLGNQISFLPVALPMDIRNPARMLKAVTARMETMKHGGAAHMVALAAGCLAAAPPPLQALFWRSLPDVVLPLPLFNLICTNVPGSPAPLYAVGRRMIASYPQVPTGCDMGVGCAVQSYDGKLFFGLIADAQAAPDVGRLRDFLYVSFRELCRAAGLKKTQRSVRTTHRTTTRSSKLAQAVPTAAPEPAVGKSPATAPAALAVNTGVAPEPASEPVPAPALLVANAKDAA
jgi:diacylglycerol O-acyltransferase